MLSRIRSLVKGVWLSAAHRRNCRLDDELRRTGQALQPNDWDVDVTSAGELSAGGCVLADLAGRFGTPLHVVHQNRLVGNVRRFREGFASLGPNLQLGFSYKTNPLPGAIRILHETGVWAEVISHFELWLAINLGMPGSRIVFNGPAKTTAALKLAVEHGVRIINLDSPAEAEAINHCARATGRVQDVGLRVVTSVGWSAQFGIPLAGGAALAAFDRLAAYENVKPIGLHIHLGTGIKDTAVYAKAVDELFGFAAMLRRERNVAIEFFDLGGGYGVPTVAPLTTMDERLLHAGYPAAPIDKSATPDPAVYAKAIRENMASHATNGNGANSPTIFFEPGRALSSSGQILLLRVLAIKPGPAGSQYVILDGGHNLALPTGYENHRIFPVSGFHRPHDQVYSFFGPLCHPGDVLARYCRMPELRVGDVTAVMDAGAYFIPNQMNFSNPRPAAVVVNDGAARLTRARETFNGIIALDLDFHAAGADIE